MEKYLSNILPSTFPGDLDIIFLTAIALIPGVRNRSIPENLLTWGPFSRIVSRHVNLFRQGEPGKVLNIIGMVNDDPKKVGLRFDGNKVIGSSDDVPQLVARWNIGVILFAIGNISLEKRRYILKRCRQTTARTVFMPDLLEMISGCLFAPDLLTAQVVSTDWDGEVPIPEVVNWLTELERWPSRRITGYWYACGRFATRWPPTWSTNKD
jgi:hypothetical protein